MFSSQRTTQNLMQSKKNYANSDLGSDGSVTRNYQRFRFVTGVERGFFAIFIIYDFSECTEDPAEL